MKKVILKTIEFFCGAKVYANHTAIKGKKSGGTRDSNGNDWKLIDGPGEAAKQN